MFSSSGCTLLRCQIVGPSCYVYKDGQKSEYEDRFTPDRSPSVLFTVRFSQLFKITFAREIVPGSEIKCSFNLQENK